MFKSHDLTLLRYVINDNAEGGRNMKWELEWNVNKNRQKQGCSYTEAGTQCMVLACGTTGEIQFT